MNFFSKLSQLSKSAFFIASLSAAANVANAQTLPAPASTSPSVSPNVANATEKTATDAALSDEEANPELAAGIDAYLAGDFDRAYRIFKLKYDANQDSNPPGVSLAFLHSNARRLVEMRRALERTAEEYPSDPEAFLQLAGIDVQEGRYLEAELLLERAERLNDGYSKTFPDSTERLPALREEALNVRANLAERRERFDAAAAFVQKIVDANPKNAQAFWNLGYLNVKLNKLDDAEKAFDEAANLDSANWRGWIQVASALDRENRVDEAIRRIESQEATIAAAAPQERAQLARLYLRWNLIPQAAKIAEELAKTGDSNNFDRWILLAWIALYANRYAAAEENFRNALFLDENAFEASNGLALALLDQNDKAKLEQASTIAATNYRRYPDSLDAAATYGWTLFLSGKTREADAVFGPMLSSGRAPATVMYYLAEIANLRGDASLALNLLDLALNQKSNFPKRAAAAELRELVAPNENADASDEDENEDASRQEPDAEVAPVPVNDAPKSDALESR